MIGFIRSVTNSGIYWENAMLIYDFPESGLYFDAGVRTATEMDEEIIQLAEAYGWVDGPANVDEDCEWLNEVSDEAIDYLNSLETRDGYYWEYGDNAEGFGLWISDDNR
jgi:hypothetical protein